MKILFDNGTPKPIARLFETSTEAIFTDEL
jgi:hypothetical protein